MIEESGRVPSAPGSREPSPDGLGPTGFDPSRGATLTVSEDAYSPFWRHTIISQILDIQDRENASREDFRPAISREMVDAALNALFGIYDCRSSDFAGAYAWTGLWTVLGVDWRKLTFLPRDSDGSGEAGETALAGSTEGDSAGPKDIAQTELEQ